MTGRRTPEERLDELEAERVRLRSDLDTAQTELATERAARRDLEDHLYRGELPGRRGRAMAVQPALNQEEREALAWVVAERRQARRR